MARARSTKQPLESFEARAWQSLAIAAIDSTHPLRNLTLATVDADGQPQARIVVLRGAKMEERTLEFHTDIRSTKWTELEANARVTVLGYSATDRLQIRLTGTTQLDKHGTAEHQQSWLSLSTWTRQSYCGGPPGDELTAPTAAQVQTTPPTEVETESGRERFGVIHFTALALDCFQHNRSNLTRALCTYNSDGAIKYNKWINP